MGVAHVLTLLQNHILALGSGTTIERMQALFGLHRSCLRLSFSLPTLFFVFFRNTS